MNPITISAQFAAFVWFTECEENAGKTTVEAMRYARENWEKFLPLAHPGLGRLLLAIANPLPARQRRPARAGCPCPATGATVTYRAADSERLDRSRPVIGAPFSCN
jgi:hypothetical protein